MGFSMIRPESRGWLATARTDAASPADADRAAATLRTDYERWSRWALGVAAYLLAVVGALLAIAVTELIVERAGRASWPEYSIAVIAAAAAALGVVTLVRLWSTGRQLTSAAAWWMRLPYTAAGRTRRASGWLRARLVNFEPRIFVRLMTAALVFIVAVGGIAVFVRDLTGDLSFLSGWAALTGTFSLLCLLGQAGGAVRVTSGVAEGDPLWAWIRAD